MNQRVHEFFLRYEQSTASSDVSKIAELYADTFMFGGASGVQAVKKEDFLKVIPKRKAYFEAMGLSDTRLESVEATPIDSIYLLAKVAWKIQFQTSSGTRDLDIFATYVLRRSSEDLLSIVFQIDHQDLANVIKELQDTQQ